MISSLRYKIAKNVLLKLANRLEYGAITLTFVEGDTHHFTGKQDGPSADLTFHTQDALLQILKSGKLGFCEAYMAGDVSSQNLVALIEMAVMNNADVEANLKMSALNWLMTKWHHMRNRNSKTGSKRNISYHYDLGNDFYAMWLDPSMTYSSAVFADASMDLSSAQEEKYRRLAEMADIQAGDNVLEIGCGWGGFAEFVARNYDVTLTAITISQEQYDYAVARMKKAGLQDKVTIALRDYRDLENDSFDKVISIEMFEAVGMAYWPTYFDKISALLKRGGKAALQVITIDDKEFDSYVATPDFIQKYIFPGGMLPSIERLHQPIEKAGMKLISDIGYGLDYARTLAEWRTRFLAAWPDIKDMKGFDTRFKNMWELYLAYCEGGFKAGMIDVKQMVITQK